MTTRRWLHVLILFTGITLIAAAVWRVSAPPRTVLVGIVTAFSAEAAPIAAMMTDTDLSYTPDVRLLRGSIDGTAIILIVTGPGMVNAAASTQRAISLFPLTHLIISGIAGSLDPTLPPETVVIPERWLNHQFVTSTDDGSTPLGITLPGVATATDGATVFVVDEGLHSAAAESAAAHVGGTGISGDAFIAGEAERTRLRDTFGAVIVDMESAAVAQVALLNGIPFIAVRAVSDSADAAAGNTIAATVDAAARAAARAVSAIIGMLE